jgi:hypothetical protein
MRADDWRPLFEDDEEFSGIVPIVTFIAGHDPETLTDMGVNADTKTWAHLELPKVVTACLVRRRDVRRPFSGTRSACVGRSWPSSSGAGSAGSTPTPRRPASDRRKTRPRVIRRSPQQGWRGGHAVGVAERRQVP